MTKIGGITWQQPLGTSRSHNQKRFFIEEPSKLHGQLSNVYNVNQSTDFSILNPVLANHILEIEKQILRNVTKQTTDLLRKLQITNIKNISLSIFLPELQNLSSLITQEQFVTSKMASALLSMKTRIEVEIAKILSRASDEE